MLLFITELVQLELGLNKITISPGIKMKNLGTLISEMNVPPTNFEICSWRQNK